MMTFLIIVYYDEENGWPDVIQAATESGKYKRNMIMHQIRMQL